MGMEFSFEELEQKLHELGRKVAKDITDEALREGAKEILKEQKTLVPKDSGDLHDSLIVGKISGSGQKRKILIGIDPAKAETVRYGYYQEHGTKVMLGKKWMKKSWYKGSEKATKEMSESLARQLGGS